MTTHLHDDKDVAKDEVKSEDSEKEEYLAGWKRERAEFENYKKEEGARMSQRDVYVKRLFLLKLLPILDSFDLALKSIPEDAKKSDWFAGYSYIQKQFEEFLKGEGIEIIETKDKEFDPSLHEAIEIEGEGETMMIQEELSRGYKIGELVVRPARVKVQKIHPAA